MYNKFNLTKKEIYENIKKLKEQCGTHSPSINTIIENIPQIKCEIDACFLSNPYATDLFMEKVINELCLDKDSLRKYLEYYPQQNSFLSGKISKYTNIPKENILVANGAIEIIEKVMNNMSGKIFMTLPNFSSYYEFINEKTQLITENSILDTEEIIKKVIDNKCNNLVIVNPNNPTGSYLKKESLIYLLDNLKHLDNIIIDESFIHFATKDNPNSVSLSSYVEKYKNLIVIKSMSKDFGIAGIRCGYAVTNSKTIARMLKKSFLWNSNGISEYFLGLLEQDKFVKDYEVSRIRYINEFENFYNILSKIEDIKVYPSKTNFYMIELKKNKAFDFATWMLVEKNIYIRTMDDKIGFGINTDNFVRIAGKTEEQNNIIYNSILEYLSLNKN